jgi:hypothetical protein
MDGLGLRIFVIFVAISHVLRMQTTISLLLYFSLLSIYDSWFIIWSKGCLWIGVSSSSTVIIRLLMFFRWFKPREY